MNVFKTLTKTLAASAVLGLLVVASAFADRDDHRRSEHSQRSDHRRSYDNNHHTRRERHHRRDRYDRRDDHYRRGHYERRRHSNYAYRNYGHNGYNYRRRHSHYGYGRSGYYTPRNYGSVSINIGNGRGYYRSNNYRPSYGYNSGHRYAPRYHVGGYYNYHERTHYIRDYGRYGLYDPPQGYCWVNDDGQSDAILTSVATGAIIGLVVGVLAYD